ncbi:MAG: glycosyltransferase [Ferruginibacter sp.]
MPKPFISICIPTYKKVQALERLLRSVALQTFTNYEIIIN